MHAVDALAKVPCVLLGSMAHPDGTVSGSVTYRVWGGTLSGHTALSWAWNMGPAVHARGQHLAHCLPLPCLLGESHKAAQSRICPIRRWPLHNMLPQFPYL